MAHIGQIVSVVGARPQFIKAATVSNALKNAGFREILVNTGQHYDANMSDIFFEQLDLSPPAYNLGIGSGSHGYQTGEALVKLEKILEEETPDIVLVYGDTNATLAGALAAAKLQYPVAHIEAGLRSFNRRMPEEVNRVMTDHLSQWLFAPTQAAVDNLANEGITKGVYCSGDVMLDACLLYREIAASSHPGFLESFNLKPDAYYLLTMHRAETTEQPVAVAAILQALDTLGVPIMFPVHPRIQPFIETLTPFRNIHCLAPVNYFEMLLLEQSARLIITDSGGVQKEAAFFEVPCITLRRETEWQETVDCGWNQLVGLSPDALLSAIESNQRPSFGIAKQYGNGQASTAIAAILSSALNQNALAKPSL